MKKIAIVTTTLTMLLINMVPLTILSKTVEAVTPSPPFSIAIITDLHVGENCWDYGYRGWNDWTTGLPFEIGEPASRLQAAVNDINSRILSENIKFVVVLGDFSDSGELSEQGIASSILNQLNVPWIPVEGNHDVWSYCNDAPLNPWARLNDHVSSIRFVNPSANPFNEGVYLYKDANYDTNHYEFFIADVSNLVGSHLGNDEASSVLAMGACWVTVYSDANYAGDYLNIKKASNLDMNDAISSIDIIPLGSNAKVEVYVDANFGGDYTTYTSDVNDVPKRGTIKKKDWISSARLYNCEAIFYKDANYQGDYVHAVGDCSNFDMGGGIHPGVSSLRVHNCNTRGAYLYEDANYGGKYSLFVTDWHDLAGTHVGNDEASSIKVMNGAEVALYADPNFGGSYTLFSDDDSDFNKRYEGSESDPPDSHAYDIYKPKVTETGFGNIEIAPAPVNNMYLFNYAFDYGGYRFIVLDFNQRSRAPFGCPGVSGEPDIYDFTGGTCRWLEDQLQGLGDKKAIIFAHHPLRFGPVGSNWLFGLFEPGEYDKIVELLKPYAGQLLGWFSGHTHPWWDISYPALAVDGTHLTEVIKVHEIRANKDAVNGHVFTFELAELPPSGQVANVQTHITYPTLQAAIDAPETLDGHTIMAGLGNYTQNVHVDKSLRIIGAGEELTRIIPPEPDDGFDCTANNVTIQGFTITSVSGCYGIRLERVSCCAVLDNVVTGKGGGILLEGSEDNTISRNVIHSLPGNGIDIRDSSQRNKVDGNILNRNHYGIFVANASSYNVISDNFVNSSDWSGIRLNWLGAGFTTVVFNNITNNFICNNYEGVMLDSPSDINFVYNNAISRNYIGISMRQSYKNTIVHNTVVENSFRGISAENSSGNSMYDNFLNNANDAWDNGANYWNTTKQARTNIVSGPYIGGNYWAKPDGTGFSQTCYDTDGDGIGDSACNISGDTNKDYLPLVLMPIHDVTVKNVTIPHREVYPGWNITAVVSNIGNFEETINVTVCINDTVIGAYHHPLPPETDDRIEAKIPYELDFDGLELYVNYTLKAYVTPVPGETDTLDNTYIYGYVTVKMTGDVNCDKKIDINDIAVVAIAFGSSTEHPRYGVKADINCDGVIDIVDITLVAVRFGWTG